MNARPSLRQIEWIRRESVNTDTVPTAMVRSLLVEIDALRENLDAAVLTAERRKIDVEVMRSPLSQMEDRVRDLRAVLRVAVRWGETDVPKMLAEASEEDDEDEGWLQEPDWLAQARALLPPETG